MRDDFESFRHQNHRKTAMAAPVALHLAPAAGWALRTSRMQRLLVAREVESSHQQMLLVHHRVSQSIETINRNHLGMNS
jgi:hypothetical protein